VADICSPQISDVGLQYRACAQRYLSKDKQPGEQTGRALFAPSQRPEWRPWIGYASKFHGPGRQRTTMTDAQLGLITATPIIIVFAAALRRMGVLSTTATISAVGLSVAIAVVLFTTQ
jgi:hypothetical protein